MRAARREWAAVRRAAVRRAAALLVTTATMVAVAGPAGARPAVVTPAASIADVDPALAGSKGDVRVIIRARAGTTDEVGRVVARLGGRVTRPLPIVDGLAATVPAARLHELAATPGVLVVSADRVAQVQGEGDSGSQRSVYTTVAGADAAWKHGATGKGVTVALVDTGVADVPDLSGRVRRVADSVLGTTSDCVNLSGEPGCGDSYGHGTFMAGIIAGSGAASGGTWKGVAPGAQLVSLKVAGRDGSADVSTVLAAIQWVVSFRDRYDIEVLNLSLGTDSTQSYEVDPLNYAVERAWAAGIVVVVSASNRGPAPGTIAKPGDDPWVITVGATDDRGTPGLGDDRLPDFSSRGPTAADGLAKPDVVAPGAHLVSLRAPGSAIDARFPTYVDGSYRRGSGTSMAAAVVSGTAALVLQADPRMSPNRVKHALAATAVPVASTDRMAVGAGLVQAHAAAFAAPTGEANAGLRRSNGLGSLDASRGSVRVHTDDPGSTLLSGLTTAQLLLWDPLGSTTGLWTPTTWFLSPWALAHWYGTNWQGTNWQGTNWQGASWYGQLDGTAWYGTNWQGSSWYGAWG